MNYYALMVGILLALSLIISFRTNRLERNRSAFPLILASFPVYYWVFALFGSDYQALVYEALIAIIFLALAYAAYRTKATTSLYLLAAGYIGHAIYDIFHNELFINAGSPIWWPEFCGAVDVLVGLYLIYLARSSKSGSRTSP